MLKISCRGSEVTLPFRFAHKAENFSQRRKGRKELAPENMMPYCSGNATAASNHNSS
jgi:hypothetical protein